MCSSDLIMTARKLVVTERYARSGDWAKIAVNWLNWQLKGDAKAGKQFQGDDCGYCKDGKWHVEFKPKG